MAEWSRQTLRLKENHQWRARAGYRIFMADRGAVRFNFPHSWVIVPEADSIKFYDQEPPEDNCVLAVSYQHLPPLGWDSPPLATLVRRLVRDDQRRAVQQGEIVCGSRADLEWAWGEAVFTDPVEGREAHSRLCLARNASTQCLITLDFWPNERAHLLPVWDEVLDSLELGVFIADPTYGSVVQRKRAVEVSPR